MSASQVLLGFYSPLADRAHRILVPSKPLKRVTRVTRVTGEAFLHEQETASCTCAGDTISPDPPRSHMPAPTGSATHAPSGVFERHTSGAAGALDPEGGELRRRRPPDSGAAAQREIILSQFPYHLSVDGRARAHRSPQSGLKHQKRNR